MGVACETKINMPAINRYQRVLSLVVVVSVSLTSLLFWLSDRDRTLCVNGLCYIPIGRESYSPMFSDDSTQTSRLKVILLWSDFYLRSNKQWPTKLGRISCGEHQCRLSDDRSQYEKSSALVFHHRSKWLKQLPTTRPRRQDQVWVLYNRESAWWGPKGQELDPANGLINWTMGLRKDNDIFIPTATVTEGKFLDGFDPNRNYSENKPNDVAVLMSTCSRSAGKGYNERQNYLNLLTSNGLNVHHYGKCGMRCGNDVKCGEILKTYKFYLAFENSICDDYISEKPYSNALRLGTVPIIMSGANLTDTRVLPPGSFIDARQFSNSSQLVQYVIRVARNPQLYNKFFEWRNKWTFMIFADNEGLLPMHNDHFCPLCNRLHTNVAHKSINNLAKWYDQQKCYPFPST